MNKSKQVQTNNTGRKKKAKIMKNLYIPDFRIGGYVPNKLHTADPNSNANGSKERVYLFSRDTENKKNSFRHHHHISTGSTSPTNT